MPGRARRYRDKVTGEDLSYWKYYQRIQGESRTARNERRTGMKTAEQRRLRASSRAMGETVEFGRVNQRYRSMLAESWARKRAEDGFEVPRNKTAGRRAKGRRRGLYSRAWAIRQPEFLDLEAQLSELARQARSVDRETSDLFAPDGPYARALVAMGRRPAGYAVLGIRVGDSPAGTVAAMQDVNPIHQRSTEGLSQWVQLQLVPE